MNLSVNRIFIIFGVSGSGKTLIGKLLADRLHVPFFDADEYHSKANIEKMKSGIPLNDLDREDWLQQLNELLRMESKEHSVVLACSALKEVYRKYLVKNVQVPVSWFLLDGSYEAIHERVKQRPGHFMPPELLRSQFDALQVPVYAHRLDVQQSPSEIIETITKQVDAMNLTIGVVGMGVMGTSLARNLGRNGFALSLYNQHIAGKEENIARQVIQRNAELSHALGFDELDKFMNSLSSPRVIICMIPAGEPIDQLIGSLRSFLKPGDVLIDGGNSHYKDTMRRSEDLEKLGVSFVGAGISGGEEGALNGPSIMVGGDQKSYDRIGFFLEKISAKDKNGDPCCTLVGNDGAGHFVKMVHNGIEYAEMQLLAEVYSILRWRYSLDPDEISSVLRRWANTNVESYLLNVTAEVLTKKEGDDWLIDKILDKAENKGTGSWTTIAAAELGVPIPTITESLFARYASFFKQARTRLSQAISTSSEQLTFSPEKFLNAYRLTRISNHHQGFHLIAAGAERYGWEIDLGMLARIWTNGCIIRSKLMEDLVIILKEHQQILFAPSIQAEINSLLKEGLEVVSHAMASGLALPAMSSAITYLQMMSTDPSNANIIQAQRDYFGAHGYECIDDPGKKNHTQWT